MPKRPHLLDFPAIRKRGDDFGHPSQISRPNARGALAAVRLSDEYFLRALRIGADLKGGGTITAIVFRAAVGGNIGYLDAHAGVRMAFVPK
jgi:hypothetical protein